MDTGIDYNHPDLAANYEGGYDFGGDFSGAPNDNDPMDFNGHGTHCAGSVAAVKDNGIGIIGVAPEADLYAVKVFSDDGYGSYSDVIEALEFCIDTRMDSDPDNDIQVISMSFGSEYSAGDPGIGSWIDAAFDAGILLVGAAGNEGHPGGVGDNVIYPARYEKVIAVAATDSSDDRASFSSTGSALELAAPGVSIYSTYLGGGYAAMSGTSMACPHVTGTAALVWNAYPDYTNTEVRQRLQVTVEDLGAPGKDNEFGYGLVDAEKAAVDITPPASVKDLKSSAVGGTWINWMWNDPVDADFSHVIVHLNGVRKTNVSKGHRFYNVNSLEPGTSYEIGTQTVDTAGNINETWVNQTVETNGGGSILPQGTGDPTNKLYESYTSDFPAETAVIDLLSSRDSTANNVDFELASNNLYTFVNATSNAMGSDIVITSGSTINFSAYFECGSRVDNAYVTWKFYKISDSTGTLICQKGDDSIGGVQLPEDGSATLTGSCTVSSTVTLNSTDKLRLVLNVWAETIGGGGAATKHAKHYWDSTYESWVQYEYIAPPKTNETSVNTTVVGVNDIICVNHTVTKGTYDIDSTWVEVTYPNGTSANITTSNTSGVCGAGGSVYGVEINVGSTTGNLTVKTSRVNDTQGNIDYDDPYPNIIVSVKDIKAPQWADPNTNKTTIYQNDYVKFTANWTDDVALAGYIFSINQTGAWVNSSFVSFSGTSSTSENVTQITAPAGTTVQWRFYANDTSDNWNVTDIQSFVVSSPAPPPSSPYMIYGWVFYKNGTACDNPVVNITNLNNSKQWQAETNVSYNYYQITLASGTDFNASEILQFSVKASDASQFNTISHTVIQGEIDSGGLFSYNITLESAETPFMLYGWVNYSNGSACDNPTVNITNTNTSTHWLAETHPGYNFYQCILDTANISEGNVLSFNATDGTQFNVTNHTVTQSEKNNGGLFNFNLTLPSLITEGPIVDSITITPDDEPSEERVQINPTPGSNKTVNISTVVSDPNGWNNINKVEAEITGPSIVADSPVTLNLVSHDTTTATYNGTFNMSFYYLNETYTVDVTATDNGLTGSNSTTFDYQTAIALELDTNTINFSSSGPIDPGETSEVLGDVNMSTLDNATVRNIGNVIIDMEVNGTNMTSNGNVITRDNIEAQIDTLGYQNMSVARCFDVSIPIGELRLENVEL